MILRSDFMCFLGNEKNKTVNTLGKNASYVHTYVLDLQISCDFHHLGILNEGSYCNRAR